MIAKSKLRERWKAAPFNKKARKLEKMIAWGRVSEHALLKHTERTPDGLVDLRGLKFDKIITRRKLKLANLDFEACQFKYLQLRKCELINVSFKNSDMGVWTDIANNFESVDFSLAYLGSSAIGLDGSIYRGVDFSHANLLNASFYRPKFIGCTFSETQLDRRDFSASSFEDVVFEGNLTNVWFNRSYRFNGDEKRYGAAEPNRMVNVDFRNARLLGVTFTNGVDLSKVIIPDDGSLILVRNFKDSLISALEAVHEEDWPDQVIDKSKKLIDAYLVHAQRQLMWILSKYEIEQWVGKEYANQFMDLVQESLAA